jgi:hypothetical protein
MKRDAKADTTSPKICVVCKTEISGNYAEMPEGITCIPCWLAGIRHENEKEELSR